MFLNPEVFQSSPGQKAGCNSRVSGVMQRNEDGFNPHPARRPDAITYVLASSIKRQWFQSSPGQKAGCNQGTKNWRRDPIRFQSSPGQKAGCNRGGILNLTRDGNVSILTRPEGRMQLELAYYSLASDLFQSSPGQKAGCNTLPAMPFSRNVRVSILTRPEGRMQLSGRSRSSVELVFQSSPGQKAGCNPTGRRP